MFVEPSPVKATLSFPVFLCCAASPAPTLMGKLSAHDRVRPDDALVEIGEVHRAALASAESAVTPEDLRERRVHRRSGRENRTVTAVGAGHGVSRREQGADPHRHSLLSLAQMSASSHEPRPEQAFHQILEATDAAHGCATGSASQTADPCPWPTSPGREVPPSMVFSLTTRLIPPPCPRRFRPRFPALGRPSARKGPAATAAKIASRKSAKPLTSPPAIGTFARSVETLQRRMGGSPVIKAETTAGGPHL